MNALAVSKSLILPFLQINSPPKIIEFDIPHIQFHVVWESWFAIICVNLSNFNRRCWTVGKQSVFHGSIPRII